MGTIVVSQDEIDTGTRKVREPSRWQFNIKRKNTGLAIKQGVRRRHPDHVLHQFQTISSQTEKAESVWEKALVNEDERVHLDKEYRWNPDTSLMSNQMGVVKTALDNYAKSKYKLEQTHIVGV